MALYMVALIKEPTKSQADNGEAEILIMAPTPIIASSEEAARMQAIVQNAAAISTDTKNIKALVRPF
jgi:hypothetical protein